MIDRKQVIAWVDKAIAIGIDAEKSPATSDAHLRRELLIAEMVLTIAMVQA